MHCKNNKQNLHLQVHVDVEDAAKPLGDVTRAALLNDCTLICAWSPEECARYLETFKAYETKPASSIQVLGCVCASCLRTLRGACRVPGKILQPCFGHACAHNPHRCLPDFALIV